MELPNLFMGDYRLLIVAPLALILVSLFFIPHIRLGVDFKSGILASAQLDRQLDAESVKAALISKGYSGIQVRYYQGTLGKNVIEIEFEESAAMEKVSVLRDKFTADYDTLLTMQLDLLSKNITAGQDAGYQTALGGLQSLANQLFAESGHSQNATDYGNANVLNTEVSDSVRQFNTRYESGIKSDLELVLGTPSVSINRVSPNLSARFIERVVWVVVGSAVLSAVVIFFIFRKGIPSLLVLTGAGSDVIIAMGAMGLFGIPLTLPSFAALLMLIGFSLDTDVLLTMRVLKIGEGTARYRVYDAMKTGVTMSTVAFLSFLSLFVLSVMTHISTYYEISAVALAGLMGDIFATWGLNAVLLLYHVEKGGKNKMV